MDLMKVNDKWTFCTAIAVAAILGICCVSGANNNLNVFTRIHVTSATLQKAGPTEEFPVFNEIPCAQLANKRQWCHLSSFSSDNGICSHYNISLPSNYRPMKNETADTVECYTDIPRGCATSDEQFYLQGETAIENCNNITCTDKGWMTTYEEGLPYQLQDCPVGFDWLEGNGCIKLMKVKKTQADAQADCVSQGGRLVIPEYFEILRQYVICQSSSPVKYVVGIYEDKWMDGRQVDANSWDQAPDPLQEKCASIFSLRDFKLVEAACSLAANFICQVP